MKKVRLIILICLLVPAVVAATVAFIIYVLPESDLIRETVQEQLSKSTGQKVVIGSLDVSASLTGLVHLSAKDVSVGAKGGKRLFIADKVILSPSLLPLLKRKLAIESITIVGFRTTFWRGKDGSMRLPVISRSRPSRGVSSKNAVSARKWPQVMAMKGRTPEERTTVPGKPAAAVAWSVKTVNLKGGRIDWVDLFVSPGRQVSLSVADINGTLRKPSATSPFVVNAQAEVAGSKAEASSVKLEGQFSAAADLSSMNQADLILSSEALNLSPFRAYIPRRADLLTAFRKAKLRAEMNWHNRGQCRVSFKADLKGKSNDRARLDISGEAHTPHDFSRIDSFRCTGETDYLPLAFLWSTLPTDFPLDPHHGVIKGSIQGNWQQGKEWQLKGSLGVEDAIPRAVFKGVADKLRIWAQIEMEPGLLQIQSLEITGPTRIVSLTGKIDLPFSPTPRFDLKGNAVLQTAWLKTFGIRLPKTLRVKGRLPVTGQARGSLQELWLDLTADLSGASVAWIPYLEKATGQKGTLTIKGKYSPTWKARNQKGALNAIMRLGMMGSRVHLSPRGTWFAPATLQLDSKIIVRGTRIDLQDAAFVLRRAGEAKETISAKAGIENLGSTNPEFQGRATINFDNNVHKLIGFDPVAGLRIAGNAPMKVRFSGSNSTWRWSVHLPVTHLDFALGESFRKPVGVGGTFKASGTWANKELIVKNASLDLPRLEVQGRGRLLDMEGRFDSLALSLSKADLKDLLRYVPSASGTQVAGPVAAALRLKQSKHGIVPVGTITLLGVTWRPKNGDISLRNMKGDLKIQGAEIGFPNLHGVLDGAIKGPLKVSGLLRDVTSAKTANGSFSIHGGPGTVKASPFMGIASELQAMMDPVLRSPEESAERAGRLRFKSVSGDFAVKFGELITDNFAIKGSRYQAGAIGKLALTSLTLDVLTGFRSEISGGQVIGGIPGVQGLLKKHKKLLEATGLGKELERFGIKAPNDGSRRTTRTPVTIILKISGPVSGYTITPILEGAVPKKALIKLKSLING